MAAFSFQSDSDEAWVEECGPSGAGCEKCGGKHDAPDCTVFPEAREERNERQLRNAIKGAKARLTRLQNRLDPGVDWTDPEYALDNVVMKIRKTEAELEVLHRELLGL